MAYIGTKGLYIAALKEAGITKHEGKSLKTFKTHVVANLYHRHVETKKA